MRGDGSGPAAGRIFEHQAHAPGHAALLIEGHGVLIAGDMLSDIEIPLLELNGPADPLGDYLQGLRMFETLTSSVDLVIPGHGAVGSRDQVRRRIGQDRAYLLAICEGRDPGDPRVGATASYGRDWLPDEHARQLRYAASRTKLRASE